MLTYMHLVCVLLIIISQSIYTRSPSIHNFTHSIVQHGMVDSKIYNSIIVLTEDSNSCWLFTQSFNVHSKALKRMREKLIYSRLNWIKFAYGTRSISLFYSRQQSLEWVYMAIDWRISKATFHTQFNKFMLLTDHSITSYNSSSIVELSWLCLFNFWHEINFLILFHFQFHVLLQAGAAAALSLIYLRFIAFAFEIISQIYKLQARRTHDDDHESLSLSI